MGIGLVSWVIWRHTVQTVEARLTAGPVWSEPARIFSRPLEIWPGLNLEPGELAASLRRAGYSQVTSDRQPGDFTLSGDTVEVKLRAHHGPGYKLEQGDVRVKFSQGRVATVTPGGRARLAPVELATLRGSTGERRRVVELGDVPPHLVQAVLAMEDADFYSHPGMSIPGLARAMVANLRAGATVQGGSTLTQQLAKNLFLDPGRTWERKAREVLFAFAIERTLTKDEILAHYLNGIYLGQAGGQAIHGVQEAARVFFGKDVERLTVGESATLAGIISAPNAWSPLRHPERAIIRRDLALDRMVAVGHLTGALAEREKERNLDVRPTGVSRDAAWGVQMAVDLADELLGAIMSGPAEIHTTLDPTLQRLAELAVEEGLAEVEEAWPKARGVEAVLVAIKAETGEVVALVGGRDFAASSFNRAWYSKRQVGSLVKPLALLGALDLEPDLSLATLLADEPLTRVHDGKSWSPANYDGQFRGMVTVREAMLHSLNIPAVHVAEWVGLQRLRRFLREAGLSEATALPSVALGAFDANALEIAGAYAAFPNGGAVVRPTLLRGVKSGDGAYTALGPSKPVRVASAGSTALVTDVLADVVRRGTGARAGRWGVGGAAGGKTGTTDSYRDAWFAGFTTELVVVTWVGFDRDRTHGLTGARAALPIWARFVAASGTTSGALPGGELLEAVELCAESHMLATDDCPERYSEQFVRGKAPEEPCYTHAPRRLLTGDRHSVIDALRELFSRPKSAAEGRPSSREAPD